MQRTSGRRSESPIRVHHFVRSESLSDTTKRVKPKLSSVPMISRTTIAASYRGYLSRNAGATDRQLLRPNRRSLSRAISTSIHFLLDTFFFSIVQNARCSESCPRACDPIAICSSPADRPRARFPWSAPILERGIPSRVTIRTIPAPVGELMRCATSGRRR